MATDALTEALAAHRPDGGADGPGAVCVTCTTGHGTPLEDPVLYPCPPLGRALLEARAAVHVLENEVGYVCRRGHFVFAGDPEDVCASMRVATLLARKDPDVEFYGPYEEADERGFVYYSCDGYSAADYAANIAEASQSIVRKLTEWRRAN